jgi:hypothetical protein
MVLENLLQSAIACQLQLPHMDGSSYSKVALMLQNVVATFRLTARLAIGPVSFF